MIRRELPLVYSCSGCSNAAQLTNHLAVRLDRSGFAEMSCIAGVGGDVPALVRVAQSGRPALVIDGCKLARARNCLARHGVRPARYVNLPDFGVHKRQHEDFDPKQAEELLDAVIAMLADGSPGGGGLKIDPAHGELVAPSRTPWGNGERPCLPNGGSR